MIARVLVLFANLVTGAPVPGTPAVPPLLQSPQQPSPGLIVSPVKIALRAGVRTGSIELRNPGTERKRFEVVAMAWQQSRDGQPKVAPTRDVFFHPALLDIAPGGKGIVRAGVTGGSAPVERTYRLIITELEPPPRTDGSPGVSLTMLTQLSIPIFVEPQVPRSEPAIESLRVAGRKVLFTLVNRGNSHLTVRKVYVRGVDPAGAAVFERGRDGWYVLAGNPQDYDLELPPDSCPRLRALEVRVETDAAPAAARLDLAGGCPT